MIDIQKLLNGNRRTLAKAITLCESRNSAHIEQAQNIIQSILPHTGKSIRIGISGTPGVGKSTFIEALGLFLVEQGKKIAVLAVDPSSPISGGSLMGDKTRMDELSQHDNAFIRPSPSNCHLGGVAMKTKEAILLCEAAGHEIILIETVGVGQSEFEVSDMVDFFLLLLLPNAGDDIQGIKKGILELAHAIVINKADGSSLNMAKASQAHYQNALHITSSSEQWTTLVTICSALEKSGIEEIWKTIEKFQSSYASKINERRLQQEVTWFKKILSEKIDIYVKEKISTENIEEKIKNKENTTYQMAQDVFSLIINKD